MEDFWLTESLFTKYIGSIFKEIVTWRWFLWWNGKRTDCRQNLVLQCTAGLRYKIWYVHCCISIMKVAICIYVYFSKNGILCKTDGEHKMLDVVSCHKAGKHRLLILCHSLILPMLVNAVGIFDLGHKGRQSFVKSGSYLFNQFPHWVSFVMVEMFYLLFCVCLETVFIWIFYVSATEEQTAQQVQDIETEQDGS